MEFLPEEQLDLRPYVASEETLSLHAQKWAYLMQNVKEVPPPDFGPDTPKVSGNCLLITLPRQNSSDYYYLRIMGVNVPAHRFSWMFHRKLASIPPKNAGGDDVVIRHLCHQSYCIAPEHLRSGTRESNADDSSKSGLIQRSRATLTDDQARAIRESKYPKGHSLYRPQKQRAEKFGVKVHIVSDIDKGITYQHVRGSDGKLPNQSKAKQKHIALKRRRKKHQNRKWSAGDWYRARMYIEKNSQQVVNKQFNGTSCREWTGHTHHHKSGLSYGRVHVNGIPMAAHVLSALISKGCKRQPPGTEVSHLCHNSKCVEPSHLKFDSPAGNMKESAMAGRLTKYVTNSQVLEIRRLHYTGTPRKVLKKQFNLTKSNIETICEFKGWAHATTPEIEALYKEHMAKKYPDPKRRPRDPRIIKQENQQKAPKLPKVQAYDGIFVNPGDKRIKLPPLK